MKIALAVIAAVVLGATAQAWNPISSDLHNRILNECSTVEGDDLTSDTSAILRSEGWIGDPTDGAERLYSPACNINQ